MNIIGKSIFQKRKKKIFGKVEISDKNNVIQLKHIKQEESPIVVPEKDITSIDDAVIYQKR